MKVCTFSSSSSLGSGRRMTLIGTKWTGAVSEREKMDDVAWAGVEGWRVDDGVMFDGELAAPGCAGGPEEDVSSGGRQDDEAMLDMLLERGTRGVGRGQVRRLGAGAVFWCWSVICVASGSSSWMYGSEYTPDSKPAFCQRRPATQCLITIAETRSLLRGQNPSADQDMGQKTSGASLLSICELACGEDVESR